MLAVFINALPAQGCCSQLAQGKIFPKVQKIMKHFRPVLVENIKLWWSGCVSAACCHQLAPRRGKAIPHYGQTPTQGPIERADAALTARGRRELHLLLEFGSSATSVDQNCSQKSQVNVYV